jgi:hypothetical protein
MKHNSHLTAITRKALPTPTRWLIKEGKVNPYLLVLDFGCGKCHSVNPARWVSYDPHYRPDALKEWAGMHFPTIICNYVLCTLPKEDRLPILHEIQSLLTSIGEAFISVRNDRPKNGWGVSSKGTYQGRVEHLPGELIYKNSQFRIYRLTKDTRIA